MYLALPAEFSLEVKKLYSLIKHDDPEALPKKDIVDTAFKEMDKDNDGSITRQEFCSAILSQDKFSKFLAVQVIDMFT